MAPNVAVRGYSSTEGNGSGGDSRGLSMKIEIDTSMATASDEKIIKCLAVAKKIYESGKKELGPRGHLVVNDHLRRVDPSSNDFPRGFVISGTLLSSMQKLDQPLYMAAFAWRWKPVAGLHWAIRGTGTDDACRYVGTRQVRELCLNNGEKTGLFMATYSLLSTTPPSCHKRKNKDDSSSEVLYLDDDLVLCNVFRPKLPAGQLPDQASHGPGENSSYSSGKEPPKKRKLPSVWENFTKIKTNNGELVYAACHLCDKIFSASSKGGTTHLRKHAEACTMQNQLRSLGGPNWFEIAKCSDKDLKYYEDLLLGD